MNEICILSGKGGTGKTGLTAAFASVAENAVFADIDVDAPDLHLIFQPEVQEKFVFEGAKIAHINVEVCTSCGLCKKKCRFGAIHYKKKGGLEVNSFECEGCRLCERICPTGAIEWEASRNNCWFKSNSRFGELVHAKMGPGEENSGKLVIQVRKSAKNLARQINAETLLNDGPPGIGCTAIASITGTDAVVIVTEPSKSGFHDAIRLINLVSKFDIPVFAVINKHDINPEITKQMQSFFKVQNIHLLGKLPFDVQMVEAVVNRKSIVEYAPNSEITREIKKMWKELVLSLKKIEIC